MQTMLAVVPGVDFLVLTGAAALFGTILGRFSKRKSVRKPPEKRIEVIVQRVDRPYRPRFWQEGSK